MIPELLVGTLAATWGWEVLRYLLPWDLPSWLKPLVAFGLALGFAWPDWHMAAGIAGAVGVVYTLLHAEDSRTIQHVIQRNPRRVPPLP